MVYYVDVASLWCGVVVLSCFVVILWIVCLRGCLVGWLLACLLVCWLCRFVILKCCGVVALVVRC